MPFVQVNIEKEIDRRKEHLKEERERRKCNKMEECG